LQKELQVLNNRRDVNEFKINLKEFIESRTQLLCMINTNSVEIN